jgi:hypothetical protein
LVEQTVDPESFAAGLSDRWLHCRELGHTWRPWGVSWERKARAYVRTVRCSGCRTERHMVVDSHGHVISSHYTYPTGYTAAGVTKGLRRDTFRLEAINRELIKFGKVSA